MGIDRRKFLKLTGTAAAGVAAASVGKDAEASSHVEAGENHVGCLVDTTLCIGCRRCEASCNDNNKLPKPELKFTDTSVFRKERRMTTEAFTVVNEYQGSPSPDQGRKNSTYVKFQCMHCIDPACVSACIVGALTKAEDGAVVYNSSICIGCRYCMVACPFQVPAYEYDKILTPKVRKCEFCADQAAGKGANPACAASCPAEAIIFGKRKDLLEMAHDRIQKRPDRYIDHVYGEREVGGTSWIYLVGREAEDIGLLELPHEAAPRLTEAIQHGIFKYAALPLAVYGSLGGLMWYNNRKQQVKKEETENDGGEE